MPECMQEELNRLRQKEVERRANHAAEVSLAFAQATAQSHQQQQYQADASASAAEYQPAAPPQITQELLRTLKVTWDKHSSSYSVDELKQIMGKHGAVEDIVLVESRKKRKGSALVVMQSLEAAQAAAEAVNGNLRNPLLVVPLAKAAAPSNIDSNGTQSRASPESYAPEQPQQQPQPTPAFPLSQSATPPTPPSSPMKAIPVRNPFGGSYATDQTAAAPAPAAASSMQTPAFAAAVPKPLFAAAAPNPVFAAALPQPLFAVGTSMSSGAAGHMPAGPFGFSAGSYSSFPGPPSSAAGHAQTGFGQNSFAHTVQAGVKRYI
jgi:DnaJ family protein C protein 17